MRIVVAVLLATTTLAFARMPMRPRPLTWGPLAWSMTEDEAVTALAKAKMTPRTGENHGYFATAPGQPPVAHTIEPVIEFVPRKGWTGEAHFAWSADATGYRIDRIELTALGLSAGALRDEIAALGSMYGRPLRRQANQMLWVRGGTWLVASWNTTDLMVHLRLDDTPPPAP